MSIIQDAPVAKTKPQGRSKPFTSTEYLDSLRDGREIWIYGERVKDVTTHPAFRNTVRMLARMYDALHDQRKDIICTPTDTGNGGYTHKFFKAPKNVDDLVGGRDAIAEWARVTYGWMGRAPDYKAAFLATLGANPDFYKPFDENARRWYKKVNEEVTFVNHAIVNPPVDRNKQLEEVRDVFMRVEKETDSGLIISGAKVVATTSTLTQYNFIANNGLLPIKTKDFAFVCIVPNDSPGLKLSLPSVLRNDGGGNGKPVRLSAVEQARRKRLDHRVRQSVRAFRERVRLRRYRQGEQLLPALRLSAAVHVSWLHAPRGEARFPRRTFAQIGGSDGDQGFPRRSGSSGRSACVPQFVLGSHRRHGPHGDAVDFPATSLRTWNMAWPIG